MTAASAPGQSSTPEESSASEHSSHGYISDKGKYLARLKRIEGQSPEVSIGWSTRSSTASTS